MYSSISLHLFKNPNLTRFYVCTPQKFFKGLTFTWSWSLISRSSTECPCKCHLCFVSAGNMSNLKLCVYSTIFLPMHFPKPYVSTVLCRPPVWASAHVREGAGLNFMALAVKDIPLLSLSISAGQLRTTTIQPFIYQNSYPKVILKPFLISISTLRKGVVLGLL